MPWGFGAAPLPPAGRRRVRLAPPPLAGAASAHLAPRCRAAPACCHTMQRRSRGHAWSPSSVVQQSTGRVATWLLAARTAVPLAVEVAVQRAPLNRVRQEDRAGGDNRRAGVVGGLNGRRVNCWFGAAATPKPIRLVGMAAVEPAVDHAAPLPSPLTSHQTS